MSIVLVLITWTTLVAPSARGAIPPAQDPFYTYEGATPLANIAPGTVLKERVGAYHVSGIQQLVTAVQLLYRSTGQLGQPTVNVTSVLIPPLSVGAPRVLSYQSAYDSLTTEDDPSYAISGGALSLGGLLPNLESALIEPALVAGETVVVPDTEGENADFSAGPEYGYNTLDSLRAAISSPATGLSGTTQIGLLGYSGGAIATEWAAELAPSYAPEVNSRLIGAAFGGTLVDPAHNLRYVEGSSTWAGVIPMSIIGAARSFHSELTPYLSEYGLQLDNKLQRASIVEVLGAYPGLTWAQLTKPQYPTPETIPAFVQFANQLIMGSRGTPTVPLFIGQGAGGEVEGTPGNKPGIGRGDGVMIAGDVRTLAREYCSRGVTVQYVEYENLGHVGAGAQWLPEAASWLTGRLAGLSPPHDCGQIAPGNSLAPLAVTTPRVLSGSLTDKKLGAALTLPAGSIFESVTEVNKETGAGSASGELSVPPLALAFKLAGLLPVSFGMSISQVGALEGTVALSETVPGDETVKLPAKLSVAVNSVSLLGLTIPTKCATTEPVGLNLATNVPREELLKTAWNFAGSVTLPHFKCQGGFLGGPFGPMLSAFLSGPENPYSLSIAP
jgi:hypothetical protein